MSPTKSAVTPPIAPMLAKVAEQLPETGEFLFEPKWDGFRALVFRTAQGLYLQSRDLRPLDRYFPELSKALGERLPRGCVLDGEIVIATPAGLDFDSLQQRLHPAASRVAKLAKETPASFVAFDLLAAGGRDIRALPQEQRRIRLEQLLMKTTAPLHLTPMTRDRAVAAQWLEHFEGAGLDGVIAKPALAPYQPGKRTMLKIKHARTADCVVAGFRWYKERQDAVGSLLLGLYDEAGVLQHAGVTSAFSMEMREQLARELEPLRQDALKDHPWRDWETPAEGDATRVPGESQQAHRVPGTSQQAHRMPGTSQQAHRVPGTQSRWSAGKDLSWEALRPERVCEVKYDHLQGDRFRHAATFLRWRPDKPAADCRYDQLEVVKPFELAQVFAPAPKAARTPRPG